MLLSHESGIANHKRETFHLDIWISHLCWGY